MALSGFKTRTKSLLKEGEICKLDASICTPISSVSTSLRNLFIIALLSSFNVTSSPLFLSVLRHVSVNSFMGVDTVLYFEDDANKWF